MADTTLPAVTQEVTPPTLLMADGQPTATSLQVAEHFGKRHTHVLRAIRNLAAELPDEHKPIFGLMSQSVEVGQGGLRSRCGLRGPRACTTLRPSRKGYGFGSPVVGAEQKPRPFGTRLFRLRSTQHALWRAVWGLPQGGAGPTPVFQPRTVCRLSFGSGRGRFQPV